MNLHVFPACLNDQYINLDNAKGHSECTKWKSYDHELKLRAPQQSDAESHHLIAKELHIDARQVHD